MGIMPLFDASKHAQAIELKSHSSLIHFSPLSYRNIQYQFIDQPTLFGCPLELRTDNHCIKLPPILEYILGSPGLKSPSYPVDLEELIHDDAVCQTHIHCDIYLTHG
jgi:hypothetical protein